MNVRVAEKERRRQVQALRFGVCRSLWLQALLILALLAPVACADGQVQGRQTAGERTELTIGDEQLKRHFDIDASLREAQVRITQVGASSAVLQVYWPRTGRAAGMVIWRESDDPIPVALAGDDVVLPLKDDAAIIRRGNGSYAYLDLRGGMLSQLDVPASTFGHRNYLPDGGLLPALTEGGDIQIYEGGPVARQVATLRHDVHRLITPRYTAANEWMALSGASRQSVAEEHLVYDFSNGREVARFLTKMSPPAGDSVEYRPYPLGDQTAAIPTTEGWFVVDVKSGGMQRVVSLLPDGSAADLTRLRVLAVHELQGGKAGVLVYQVPRADGETATFVLEAGAAHEHSTLPGVKSIMIESVGIAPATSSRIQRDKDGTLSLSVLLGPRHELYNIRVGEVSAQTEVIRSHVPLAIAETLTVRAVPDGLQLSWQRPN